MGHSIAIPVFLFLSALIQSLNTVGWDSVWWGGTTPSGIPALEDTQMCLLNAQLHNSNYLNVE